MSQASEVVRHRGIGAAATPDGGSWLVAADRGMFGFGDAQFQGSVAGVGIAGQAVGGAARPV
ncbi:MAG: hypothetical protein ACRD0L_03890 [Acidimicrobiales bacterium]